MAQEPESGPLDAENAGATEPAAAAEHAAAAPPAPAAGEISVKITADTDELHQKLAAAREDIADFAAHELKRRELRHRLGQVRDRAKLAIRQHDLRTLGEAVHDLADLLREAL
jgi:multidrug efflux pump subunit AcrB